MLHRVLRKLHKKISFVGGIVQLNDEDFLNE